MKTSSFFFYILPFTLLFTASGRSLSATTATPLPAPKTSTSTQGITTLQVAGKVVWVKGAMEAVYPDQSPRALERGSVIYEKDTIITEMASAGEIILTDNSILSMRPSTTFALNPYQFNPARPEIVSRSVINLIQGGFRTITGFVAKIHPENYAIKTPVATIGVRGTFFQVNYQAGVCAVGLEKGSITMSNAGGMVTVNPTTPYAIAIANNILPALSNTQPALLSRPPLVTSPTAPLPKGSNEEKAKSGGNNCGILIQ